MLIQKLSRLDLLNEFESAPESALFNQQTIAAVLSCSTQLLERNRWEGRGVPFVVRFACSSRRSPEAGFQGLKV